MKVRIYGYALHLGKGISNDDFFHYLEAHNGQEFDNRILTVAKQGDYWTGLLITIKDSKAYCQLQRSGSAFTISAKELEEGTSMADFNFFICYGHSGRGLYQYYHQSAHIAPFCLFLKKRYDVLKQQRIEDHLAANGERTLAAERKAKAAYADSLKFTALVRKETLLERMKDWKAVKNLQFQFETLEFQHDPMTPLNRVARTRTERFTFRKDSVDLVKTAIRDFLHHKTFKSLRVVGVDPAGIEQIYKLQNDYDTFGEFEYDELIRTVSVDSNDLLGSVKRSQMIQALLRIAENKAKVLLTSPAMP